MISDFGLIGVATEAQMGGKSGVTALKADPVPWLAEDELRVIIMYINNSPKYTFSFASVSNQI